MKPRLLTLFAALLIAPMPLAGRQLGVSCTISANAVDFAGYSVFAADDDTAQGSVTLRCTLGLLIRVELDRGASTTFTPRTMKNGSSALNYNLYLDSNYATVWGDGSGTTSRYSQTLSALVTTTVPVFGKAPKSQDVPGGPYTDSVSATIVF